MSELCLNSLITIFSNDLTGSTSLEAVRLLNRMVKERRFNVHPRALSCLLHLRLKTELGVRASATSVDKVGRDQVMGGKNKRRKGKDREQPHLSKKAKKALKERKEIQREFREAEAEVDKEERAAQASKPHFLVIPPIDAHEL